MSDQLALILSALGVGAILREVAVAILQRKKIGIDGAAVISAAAAELVEPLRKSLADERAQHAAEVAEERLEVAGLREDLASAQTEVRELRAQLALARVDVEALAACRQAREVDARTIRALRAQLGRRRT